MKIIKKLDKFILKNFILIFIGGFFVCLFVFMMQFTWRYVDELIGKGLSLEILAKFFWHMAITLIPSALPIAVLLASLIAFGNMGERLELLAMKAAGVPLIRIMRPLMFVALAITGVSFFFQNSISPQAQIDLRTLLISMRQSSPAVEIPEGIFYNGVPNVNLYVQKKNTETGMLYQIIIYKTDKGFDRAQIVLADSGRMEMTADKMHLKLELWRGEQFENLQSENLSNTRSAAVPYDRETFAYKQMLIDFDSNFNLMDADMLKNMASAKTMSEIEHSVDSMKNDVDSIGRQYFYDAKRVYYYVPQLQEKDSVALARQQENIPVDIDKVFSEAELDVMMRARETARNKVHSLHSELEWKRDMVNQTQGVIRSHWVEWHQKMTLSLSCLLFFFIGAPLGAIIRKGGLGLPTVISVIIFIIYYIINISGLKMARNGSWDMICGMWISSVVLLPFGVFFTYKANRDSTMFNTEYYQRMFRALFGLRTKRNITRKNVIIEDPDIAEALADINALRDDCRTYSESKRLYLAPNYFRLFFRSVPDTRAEDISEREEKLVTNLANSRNREVLKSINELPVIYVHAHTAPFTSKRLNIITGIIFPIGVILWVRIWRFRLRLLGDMKQMTRICDRLETILQTDEAK